MNTEYPVKKRMLVLNHNLVGEGTWLRAWNLTRQLSEKYKVTLLAVSPERSLTKHSRFENRHQAVEAPFWGNKRLAASGLSFVDILFRIVYVITHQWDVLYGFGSLPNVSIPFLIAKQLFPKRHFVSDWDDLFSDGGIYEYLNKGLTRPLYRFERWLEFTVRRQADLVTVTSRYLEDKTKEIGVQAPVYYLPAGTDIDRIQCIDRSSARKRLNLPDDTCIIYYLGAGLSEDCLLLLDAFALALKRKSDLLLLMTGNLCPEYDIKINELNIRNHIIQTGRIPYADIAVHMATANLLAMPMHDGMNSRARGPIKLRDYLCAGRPIAGTALGEVKDVLSHYAVGQMADLGPESFAEVLIQLASNPSACETMSIEARRVAEQELSWKILTERFMPVLKKVTG